MPGPNCGLIETIRVRGGCLPLLPRHLVRLEAARHALGMSPLTRSVEALALPFAEVGEGVLRIEVRAGRPTVTVREPWPQRPPRVIVATRRHVAYPHKTTSRESFEAAALEARYLGADDALLLTETGFVAEGTVWTVCWWEGTRLRSPGLELGILPGVGRARVAELEPFEEGSYTLGDVQGRSLFLVNAVRGVVPIAMFQGRQVPPDPRTAALSRRFWPD